MKKIYIDLDSTLNNLIYVWLKWGNKKYSKKYTIKDVKKWETILELYPNALEFFGTNPYERDEIHLFNGAKELVEALKELGEVIIISDTYPVNKEEKEEFINKHFPDTQYILSEFDKKDYVKSDILIDDNFHNVYDVVKNEGKGVLFKIYEYNDFIFNNQNYKVAKNYPEILKEVKGLL